MIPRTAFSVVFFAICAVPFVIFAGCSDDAPKTVAPAPTATNDRDTGPTPTVLPAEDDAGPARCIPTSSVTPPVSSAPLAGSVGGAAFPAAPKSWARPVASLPGFYEIDISEGASSCTNREGGERGVRLVVASDGNPCLSTDPARAQFYRKTDPSYTRPAGTEGAIVAKPSGTQLEVGMVIGAFADRDGGILPADGLNGTTKVDICP